MSAFEVHPAAAAWPMLPEDELRALADSIAEVGLLEPVVLTGDGLVLDGRNRLAACELAGVEPTFTTYPGDAVAFVLARNENRRHMSKGQRAMSAWMTTDAGGKSFTTREVAQSIDVTHPMIVWASTVAEVTPDAVRAVTEGRLALKQAYDDALKIRRDADSDAAKFARLPGDLAAQVRDETLTLSEAVAAAKVRADERAKLIRDGERASERLTNVIADALAVIGAIQQGATGIEPAPLITALRKAADALDDETAGDETE